jgi:hypothetical protein
MSQKHSFFQGIGAPRFEVGTALAIESGCEWITTDRDYAGFPGLSWREPL